MNHYKRHPDPRLINSKNETKDVKKPILIQEQKTNPNPNPNLITQNNSNLITQNNSKDDKKDIPIPNALTITINTSIPGYQEIKYKPNMTIQDTNETTICFDPLIPLKESVIDKVPESIKVLEFFNKGLFKSMINSHGNQTKITLKEAKQKKIIDNNIQITLNTLFPSGGVLYIGGQPYAIADVQWTKGNWKIDKTKSKIETKYKTSKEIIDSKKNEEENKKTDEEFKKIPNDLLFGSSFDTTNEKKTSVVVPVVTNSPVVAPVVEPVVKPVVAPVTLANDEENLRKKDQEWNNYLKSLEDDAKRKDAEEWKKIKGEIPTPNPITPVQKPITPVQKPIPSVPNPIPPVQKPIPTVQKPIPPVPNPIPPVAKPITTPELMTKDVTLKVSESPTDFLRNYFSSKNFYYMIFKVFQNMDNAQKATFYENYKNTTGVTINSFPDLKTAYLISILGSENTQPHKILKGLQVIDNIGGGDCFFIAVADAINFYNSKSENKITNGRNGIGDNLFTQKYLRTLIADYILSPSNIDTYLTISEANSDGLNQIFQQQIEAIQQDGNVIDETIYKSNITSLYSDSDNFLVKFPEIMPPVNSPEYYTPFKKLNADEIKQYIESNNYWADLNTIKILGNILKINIIPIQEKNGILYIPDANLQPKNIVDWTKYLFLYHSGGHYELITFDFIINKSVKTFAIFDVNNDIIPPFYILFLLFSTYFLNISQQNRSTIEVFYQYMFLINESFNKIYNRDPNNADFIRIFKQMFPGTQNLLFGGGDNKEESLISFYITIDMELQKGKTLSKEQMSNIKCIKGWNKVRKSYADFTGKKYVIAPVYDNLSDKYNKKEENKKEENKNITKKNTGGKRRRRTLKYLK
jgi:hypothetical protein